MFSFKSLNSNFTALLNFTDGATGNLNNVVPKWLVIQLHMTFWTYRSVQSEHTALNYSFRHVWVSCKYLKHCQDWLVGNLTYFAIRNAIDMNAGCIPAAALT